MTLPINDCPHCGCSTFYRNQGGYLWDLIYLYIVETKKSGVKNHCFAQFHSHYGSKKNDILLSLLKITLESTADVKEEDWEGLDYDGTTTLSNVKNAKNKLQVQSQSLGLSLEAKEKIENFLDTIIDLADSEKLYLSWG